MSDNNEVEVTHKMYIASAAIGSLVMNAKTLKRGKVVEVEASFENPELGIVGACMAFTDLEKAQAYAEYMTELTGANVVVLKLSDADDTENELCSGPRLSLPDNFDPESN